MKSRISIIFGLGLFIGLVALTSQGEVLGQDTGFKEFFFPLPPYRLNRPVIPDSTVQKIKAILDSNPGTLHWIGTADTPTQVYDDLEKGIPASRLDQRNSNLSFARDRAVTVVNFFGGTYEYKIVPTKEERGLYLRIRPLVLPEPIALYLSPKEVSLFVGQTITIEPFVIYPTGMVPVRATQVEFSILGDATLAAVDSIGRVIALKPGTATVAAIYKLTVVLASASNEYRSGTIRAETVLHIQPIPEAPSVIIINQSIFSDWQLQTGVMVWSAGKPWDLSVPYIGLTLKSEKWALELQGGVTPWSRKDPLGNRGDALLLGAISLHPDSWYGVKIGVFSGWEFFSHSDQWTMKVVGVTAGPNFRWKFWEAFLGYSIGKVSSFEPDQWRSGVMVSVGINLK